MARPRVIVAVGALCVAASVLAIPSLVVDQRFNEGVPADHPVRADHRILEEEFGGYLGPEVSVRLAGGGSLLAVPERRRLREYQEEIARQRDVLGVRSFLDLRPPELPAEEASAALETLRADPRLGPTVREMVSADGSWMGFIVRTPDIGTERAEELQRSLESTAAARLGSGFEARVVGRWQLAQEGLRNLMHDLLASFALSCVIVLPFLLPVLRDRRLFLVSLVPNLLPMAAALGFMAVAGISIRIGTAMILAIALGIAIDDTIHFMVGLRKETSEGVPPAEAVRRTLAGAGRGILYTTVVLVIGFLSMATNELLAVRDMGIVAAVTLLVAFAADLLLVPALYLLVEAPAGNRSWPSRRRRIMKSEA